MAQLHVYGARGSSPVSGPQFTRYGGQTTCYAVESDEHLVVVDAGSGLAEVPAVHAGSAGAREVTILFTHFHVDHIIGLYTCALRHSPNACIRFVSSSRTYGDFRKTLEEAIVPPYSPIPLAESQATIEYVDLDAEDGEFSVGDLRISYCPIPHPQSCLAYRIDCGAESVVIATDVELGDTDAAKELQALASGAGVLVCDAQFTPEEYEGVRGWGHSTWEQAVELAESCGCTRLILTHHDAARSDDEVDGMVEQSRVRFARTEGAAAGMIVPLEGSAPVTHMRIDHQGTANSDLFQSLLDDFPDMIHSINDQGSIVYANKTAESLLGYTRDELLSMSIWEIYADEIMDAVREGFKNLKRRGDYRVESVLKNKEGERIPVEIRSFGIYDDDGNFIRTFSILRDMRPIKELQNNLVHAGRLAAIGELASGVAHDINNPLTVVTVSSEMMLSQLRGEEKVEPDTLRSWCEDIQKASRSIGKLSDHLRNFSRGIVEKYAPLDIYDVLEDSLFITSNKIHVCRCRLENTVTKGRHYTIGSMNQLEQVFVNLISNACDAMADRETRALTIQMSSVVEEDEEYWACEISDTGSGIPTDVVEHIFQSFFTTKPKGKGTGLGLSISRGIIRDHGGDIQVASTPEVGTLFSVLLPRAEKPEPGAEE